MTGCKWWIRPEWVFAFFALTFGFVFTWVTPPFTAGDEFAHYQRVASIAYGQMLNKKVEVAPGIARFIHTGSAFVFRYILFEDADLRKDYLQKKSPLYSGPDGPLPRYSFSEYRQLADISLAPHDKKKTLEPSFLTIYNPMAFSAQLVAFYIGLAMHVTPFALLMLARFAGLFASIVITFTAIRVIPAHKYLLCTLALLPTITFYRSYLNADTIALPLAFLLVAIILRETIQHDHIEKKTIVYLSAIGFILGQCKSPYLFLLVLAYAIPRQRFTSPASRLLALAIIIMPAVLGALVWLLIMKYTYFHGLSYFNNAGEIFPDQQMQFILNYPLQYVKIMALTWVSPAFLSSTLIGLLADPSLNGYPAIACYPMLGCGIMAIIKMETEQKNISSEIVYPACLRWLAIIITVGGTCMILTLLYLYWTPVASPVIKGFQGRYFYPFVPLFFVYLKAKVPQNPCFLAILTSVVAITGFSFTLWFLLSNYWF